MGALVSRIRSGIRKTTFFEEATLDAIGFKWKICESPLTFDEVFNYLTEYKEKE